MPFPGLVNLVGSPNKLGSLLLELASAAWKGWRKRNPTPMRQLIREFWPVVSYVAATFLLLVCTCLSLFKVLTSHSVNWRLQFWICTASAVITLLPLASKVLLRSRYHLSVALEVVVLGLTLSLFGSLILRLPFLHRWTLCAVLLVVLLSVGGRGIEMIHKSIGARLAYEWDSSLGKPVSDKSKSFVKSHLALLDRYFTGELVLYSALPVGTLLGLLFCWTLAVDFRIPLAVVSICLRWVFGLSGIVIMAFLVTSFVRMADPVLFSPNLSRDDLKNETPAANDWGCILTDYRKMFFFDAMQNIALLLAFGTLEWFLWDRNGLSMGDLRFFAVILAASIVLNEIPYLIGQKRVQVLLVSPYRGWEKSEKKKEVEENIPLVPRFEFIAALVGEASAGGLALEMMKQLTEAISKKG